MIRRDVAYHDIGFSCDRYALWWYSDRHFEHRFHSRSDGDSSNHLADVAEDLELEGRVQWHGRYDTRRNAVSIRGPRGEKLPIRLVRHLRGAFPGAELCVAPDYGIQWTGREETKAAPEPLTPYDCAFRGKAIGVRKCEVCGGKERTVFECSNPDVPQAECTIRTYKSGRQPEAICLTCDKRREPTFEDLDDERVEALVKELEGPARPRHRGWEKELLTFEAHRRAISRQAAVHQEPPETSGRGIVIAAGGRKYFICGYVLIRLLRDLGCELPIQLWHLGAFEFDDEMCRIAESLPGVEVIDARKRLGDRPRILGGWQLKVWAIQNSGFSEVLFLDADNVPVKDPTYLFDDENYLRTGATFWPDYVPSGRGHDVTAQAWRTMSLPVPARTKPRSTMPTDYRPFETGQILVNVETSWNELELTRWLNDHSDYFYAREREHDRDWLIYGDKSTFLLAWQKIGSRYAMPKDSAWLGRHGKRMGGAFLQHDMDGELIFQHRCQPVSKLALDGSVRHPAGFVHGDRIDAYLADLRKRWDGIVWSARYASDRERELMHRHAGRWVFHRRKTISRLTLKADGTCTKAAGADHWRIVLEGGKSYLLILGKEHMRLGWTERLGYWHDHGQDRFLMRAPPPGWQMTFGKAECGMWRDIVLGNEYGLNESIVGRVVDVGAHSGIFTMEAIKRGASIVHAVEPSPLSVSHMRHNVSKHRDRVVIYPLAVGKPGLSLARLAAGSHTGERQLSDHHGEQVLSVGLDDILRVATDNGRERIALLKLDCEGGEWPGLFASHLLPMVNDIVGEYHLQAGPKRPTWSDVDGARYDLDGLRELLRGHSFRLTTRPNADCPELLGNFWATQCRHVDHPDAPDMALIHVPKTGGTSLRHMLREAIGLHIRQYGHRDWDAFSDYSKKLVVLREPVQRMISHYNWTMHTQKISRITLEQFAGSDDWFVCRNPLTRALCGKFGPRRNLPLVDGDLDLALCRLREAYWVGWFDRFEESVRRLESRLGVKLPRHNYNDCPDHVTKESFGQADLAAVAELNAMDVQLYRLASEEHCGG